jgi:hypothetical protein
MLARRYVYDGVLEAQFIMVHDANKQLLGVADIYPGAHLPACTSSADMQRIDFVNATVLYGIKWQTHIQNLQLQP